jgi:hypothetical protein
MGRGAFWAWNTYIKNSIVLRLIMGEAKRVLMALTSFPRRSG